MTNKYWWMGWEQWEKELTNVCGTVAACTWIENRVSMKSKGKWGVADYFNDRKKNYTFKYKRGTLDKIGDMVTLGRLKEKKNIHIHVCARLCVSKIKRTVAIRNDTWVSTVHHNPTFKKANIEPDRTFRNRSRSGKIVQSGPIHSF